MQRYNLVKMWLWKILFKFCLICTSKKYFRLADLADHPKSFWFQKYQCVNIPKQDNPGFMQIHCKCRTQWVILSICHFTGMKSRQDYFLAGNPQYYAGHFISTTLYQLLNFENSVHSMQIWKLENKESNWFFFLQGFNMLVNIFAHLNYFLFSQFNDDTKLP